MKYRRIALHFEAEVRKQVWLLDDAQESCLTSPCDGAGSALRVSLESRGGSWEGRPGSGTMQRDLLPELRVKFSAALAFSKFQTGLDFFLFNYSVPTILGAVLGCGDKNIFRKNEGSEDGGDVSL